MDTFINFFEQTKVRKGGAGKSSYTGTRIEKDKKKEQSKTKARSKVKEEDAQDRCKRKADSVYGKKYCIQTCYNQSSKESLYLST